MISTLMAATLWGAGAAVMAAGLNHPIAPADLVFEEVDGVLAVEAEHFCKQTLTDKRAWYLTTSQSKPDLKPDADPAHVAGASGGAYLEILPDTRATANQKLIQGENFTDQAGLMTVLHYHVQINTPGRYYVWGRVFSTGPEDNGMHIGLDGQWPASGQRWQTVQKQQWAWDCKQRTAEVHIGVPMQLFLDIEKAGEHEIMISMREDGFELDKFVLARNKAFKPEGKGPAVKVKAGKLPASFPEVAVPAPDVAALSDTASSATGVKAPAGSLALTVNDFKLAGSGYYLDKGKWAAINPSQNKDAKASATFPYPSGRYDVTLQAVGESDGSSTYQVLRNAEKVGDFTCPMSAQTFEEGAKYHTIWKNIAMARGDTVTIASQIASADGQEHSRARWAGLVFTPADEATRKAIADLPPPMTPPASSAPAKPAGSPLQQPRQPDGKGTVAITGELKQWHQITLTFDGPYAHELDNAPNPFTDYALTVTFTHESGAPKHTVPGYFAADGNAANTSAESGTKWRAHLSPDKPGQWTYAVAFVSRDVNDPWMKQTDLHLKPEAYFSQGLNDRQREQRETAARQPARP